MNKFLFFLMLMSSAASVTSCTQDDPYEEYFNNWMNNNVTPNTSSGNSSTTGELASFDVAIDKTTAEPTDVATAYYPDEEDMLENNDFSTEVAIDLSNPVSKTVNGVEITVNGSHVTANHGSEKKVCYVVSGSTTNGSLTILGEKKYAVKLNGVSITNHD